MEKTNVKDIEAFIQQTVKETGLPYFEVRRALAAEGLKKALKNSLT